ncbi:hypothetical protein B0H14DRAFT_3714155 [Mycena olivaceomarginata]|nr:hypothetical protein B0H14DRAFT_3714155 [Mycena olivaceomarginata]
MTATNKWDADLREGLNGSSPRDNRFTIPYAVRTEEAVGNERGGAGATRSAALLTGVADAGSCPKESYEARVKPEGRLLSPCSHGSGGYATVSRQGAVDTYILEGMAKRSSPVRARQWEAKGSGGDRGWKARRHCTAGQRHTERGKESIKPTPGYPTLAPHENPGGGCWEGLWKGSATAQISRRLSAGRSAGHAVSCRYDPLPEDVMIVPVRGNTHWWLGAGETVAHKRESRRGNGEMEEGGARGIPQVGRAGHKRQSRPSGVGRAHRHRVGWVGQPTVVMDEMWGRAPQRQETRRAGWTAQRRGHGARAMGQAESGARPPGRCFISENGRSPRTTPRSDGRARGTISADGVARTDADACTCSATERGCHLADSPPGGAIVAEASLGRVGHSPLGQQGRRAVRGGRAIGDLGEPTRAQIGRAKLAGVPATLLMVWHGVSGGVGGQWQALSPGGGECGTRALGLWRGACAPRRTPRASSRRGRNESPVRAMRLRRGELRVVVLDERLAQSLAAMSLAPGAQAAGRGRQFHRSGEDWRERHCERVGVERRGERAYVEKPDVNSKKEINGLASRGFTAHDLEPPVRLRACAWPYDPWARYDPPTPHVSSANRSGLSGGLTPWAVCGGARACDVSGSGEK